MYLYTFLAVDVHAMGDSRIQGLATPTHFVALCGTKSSTQFPVQKETKGDTITKNQCVVCKTCAENSAKRLVSHGGLPVARSSKAHEAPPEFKSLTASGKKLFLSLVILLLPLLPLRTRLQPEGANSVCAG